VSSSWPARVLVGTPAILVTGAAILLLWGAGTFPRFWIGLTILLAWHAAWSSFRMRRTCVVNVADRRVTVLRVSLVMYRPMGVVFDEVRPGPTLTLGPPDAFDTWFSIRGRTGLPMSFVTDRRSRTLVGWSAAMTTDGVSGVDAEAEYRTGQMMTFMTGSPSPDGRPEEIDIKRVPHFRRIVGRVLIGIGAAVAVISALVGGPPSFLGSSWILTAVFVLGTSVTGLALIRWNKADPNVSDQRARIVASISIVALCVGIGGEFLRHPTPMVAVGNLFPQEGTVTVVGAACGSDELQSISVIRPADPTAGRPREILWAISDPTPDRGVYIFDVGVAVEGYVTDVELAEPLSFYEPVEVEVDTRRSSTSLPFVIRDLEPNTFLTPTGTLTFEEVFGFTSSQLAANLDLPAPQPRC